MDIVADGCLGLVCKACPGCGLAPRLLRRRRGTSSLRRALNTLIFTTGGHDLPSLSQATQGMGLLKDGSFSMMPILS